VPVLFGPRHGNAREAAELVSAGGAYAAPRGAALVERLELWMRDGDARRTAGAAARRYVADNLGAAERGAEIIEELLNG
jgi:3-deoxy-D-manno-octulosonic-acid transferase